MNPKILELVQKQAEDESLWFISTTIREAQLQGALRHLHAVIEDEKALAEFYSKQYGTE